MLHASVDVPRAAIQLLSAVVRRDVRRLYDRFPMVEWTELGTVRGDDGSRRCAWCVSAPDYVAYHDGEWGRPVTADARLLEKICLEGFQSGLSWLTILRKRDAFRRAFAGFAPEVLAEFGTTDVERLLADASIVRHRGKIEATNCQCSRHPGSPGASRIARRLGLVLRAPSTTPECAEAAG